METTEPEQGAGELQQPQEVGRALLVLPDQQGAALREPGQPCHCLRDAAGMLPCRQLLSWWSCSPGWPPSQGLSA